MATTNKADIIAAIQEQSGVSRIQSIDVMEAAFEAVSQRLEQGESVSLSGFGVFTVRAKRAHRGRNPKSGDRVEISARSVVTFRPSRILRGHVDSSYSELVG